MRPLDHLRAHIWATVLLLMLSGCSLYESTGRKAIETNQNDIVGAYGFNARHSLQYNCLASHQSPKFLQYPLQVVVTPYEADGMTVLIDNQSHPAFLAIEKTVQQTIYLSCTVKFLKMATVNTGPDLMDISDAAKLGHDQIVALRSALSRDNQTNH